MENDLGSSAVTGFSNVGKFYNVTITQFENCSI